MLTSKSTPAQISLANQLEELERLSAWLSEIGDSLNLSNRAIFGLDLILAEAVTNIIDNAYQDDQVHQIQIKLATIESDQKVILTIEDDGIPFNPLETPEAELPATLEEAKIGGLGIHLIRNYSDECYYQRQDDQNYLKIVVYNAISDPSLT
ncbi:MAG: ATP-binding protein [Microcystaceae cyanobacterium]